MYSCLTVMSERKLGRCLCLKKTVVQGDGGLCMLRVVLPFRDADVHAGVMGNGVRLINLNEKQRSFG